MAELIETEPATLEIARYVESSWTMGVAERVPSAPDDKMVRSISRRIPLPVWGREPVTDAEVAHLEELKTNLAKLRAGLRERMTRSPLMDAPRFARNMEAAYRRAWCRWCTGRT